MLRPPHKPRVAAGRDSTPRVQVDDRPWRSPPRSGRKSPSRTKASSPGRRKARRSQGDGGGAAAPHTPTSYRDVTVGTAATSSGGLVSHQALPRSAGLTRLQAVKQGAADGPDSQAIDPAAHAATIDQHMAELCATLTADQSEALQAQRAAVVAEMALMESILRDRRLELRVIDETLAGIRLKKTRRRRSSGNSGARSARKSSRSPARSKETGSKSPTAVVSWYADQPR